MIPARALWGLTSLALLSIGPVAVLASRALVVVLLLLFLLVTLMVYARGPWRIAEPVPSKANWAALWLCGFLAYMGLSVLWSEDIQSALVAFAENLLIVLPGLFLVLSVGKLKPLWRQRIVLRLLLGALAFALLLTIEFIWSGPIGVLIKGEQATSLRYLNHAASILPLLLWSAIALGRALLQSMLEKLPATRAVAVYCLAWGVGLLLTVLSPVESAKLAYMVASALFVLGYFRVARAILLLAVVTILLMLSAPFIASRSGAIDWIIQESIVIDASWMHRLVIWEYFSAEALQQPLFGHGLASSHFSNATAEDRAHYAALASRTGNLLIAQQYPTHPHNTIIQLWFELGLMGVLLYVASISAAAKFCWRLANAGSASRVMGACGLALLGSYLVLSNISFGAFQKWWLAILCIAVFAWTIARSAAVPGSLPGRDSSR